MRNERDETNNLYLLVACRQDIQNSRVWTLFSQDVKHVTKDVATSGPRSIVCAWGWPSSEDLGFKESQARL